MNLADQLKKDVCKAFEACFESTIQEDQVALSDTASNFEGDITVVVFALVRYSKSNPVETCNRLGEYLVTNFERYTAFNVVKGFLNIVVNDTYWLNFFKDNRENTDFGKANLEAKIVLEYCGPNTNKPLHLGHIRNMLIGYSTAELLSFAGNEVHKVNIYNDRGINISKSMVAWMHYANGETPETANMKGDFFVGKYYVLFSEKSKEQIKKLIEQGLTKEEAEEQAPLVKEARELLLKWENGDAETIALWEKMNNWCYAGFEETFKNLGVDFEKHYKESDYYLAGKTMVEKGLEEGIFYQKDDQSVWVNLEDEGLDHKLLLRADGTSVYITQDMGVAQARYDDYQFDQSIYVVADEQEYHFKVLALILKKMNKAYAEGIYHLSYGLVNLPEGRMKSREGTVVDADDLIETMIQTAKEHTEELGKVDDFSDEEAKDLYKTLALGALKYFILKINPKRTVIFNPKESIDFQGNTGPFIQFNYVRIQSLLRNQALSEFDIDKINLTTEEKEMIQEIHKFPAMIENAAQQYDISSVANYAYSLAKAFSKFYSHTSILKVEDENTKQFRLALSQWVGNVLKQSFLLLGIEMPTRM